MATRIRKTFVESGWQAYRNRCVPKDATAEQLMDYRQAYFAGAAILQQTILRALSHGPGATHDDMIVMQDLQAELDEFGQQIDRRVLGINSPTSHRKQ